MDMCVCVCVSNDIDNKKKNDVLTSKKYQHRHSSSALFRSIFSSTLIGLFGLMSLSPLLILSFLFSSRKGACLDPQEKFVAIFDYFTIFQNTTDVKKRMISLFGTRMCAEQYRSVSQITSLPLFQQ